jgi:hypothetical protein
MSPTCQAPGCNARAWAGPLCSFHALEELRARRRQAEPSARVSSRSRRDLRSDAARLGITLDERAVVVARVASGKKPRSPVA